MTTEADPIPGCWYRHLDKGQEFCVIATDDELGLIEIQYFDGDLEEFELQDWQQMELELIDEPENWAGALDIAEIDDFGTSITDTPPDDWKLPANEIHEKESTAAYVPFEETADDWEEGTPREEPWESQ